MSGMLKKEVDHRASKGGPPALALGDFFSQSRPFSVHPNHLFMNQRATTEKMTEYPDSNIQSGREGGKTRSRLICGPCFFLAIVQTGPAHDSE